MTLLICGVLCLILMKTVLLGAPSEASAPGSMRARVPSPVATLPATTSMSGAYGPGGGATPAGIGSGSWPANGPGAEKSPAAAAGT